MNYEKGGKKKKKGEKKVTVWLYKTHGTRDSREQSLITPKNIQEKKTKLLHLNIEQRTERTEGLNTVRVINMKQNRY